MSAGEGGRGGPGAAASWRPWGGPANQSAGASYNSSRKAPGVSRDCRPVVWRRREDDDDIDHEEDYLSL
eukprot:6197806-Pyramimonas_sp.AAC.1